MDLQVLKKDGQLQPFDRAKIAAGLVKSGVSVDQAQALALQAETWAQGAAQNGIVNASEIRVRVLELLRVANPTAADAFEAYQKPQPQV